MEDNVDDSDTSPRRRQDDQVRLESWKSIANYLKRSVRTVRRWESSEGLPVHRHVHGKGASVYAIKAELDEWQQRRVNQHNGVVTEGTLDDVKEDTGQHRWRYVAALSAAFVLGVTFHYGLHPDATESLAVPSQSDLAKEQPENWARSTTAVVVAPVFELWADGKIMESLQASQKLQDRLRDMSPEIRGRVAELLVHHAISLGQAKNAMVVAEVIDDTNRRSELRAAVFFATGDKQAMRAELEKLEAISNVSTAMLMAMVGLNDKALKGVAQFGSAEEQRLRSLVVHGMAAMQAGDVAAAKSRLNAATLTLDIEDHAFYFVAHDMLSNIQRQDGDIGLAIKILEDTMNKRRRAASGGSGIFWLMCQTQLAKLYRADDRVDDADRIEAERLHFMSLADRTFPLAAKQLT